MTNIDLNMNANDCEWAKGRGSECAENGTNAKTKVGEVKSNKHTALNR